MNIEKIIELLTALIEGKEVEYLNYYDNWVSFKLNLFRLENISEWCEAGKLRIKPEPVHTYKEKFDAFIKQHNLEEGGWVKVIREPTEEEKEEMNIIWISETNKLIGKIYEIQNIASTYIRIKDGNNSWLLPFHVLEPVKYKPYEKVDPKWIGKVVIRKADKILKSIQEIDLNEGVAYPIRAFNSFHTLKTLFDNYEWYDPITGKTEPCGEII